MSCTKVQHSNDLAAAVIYAVHGTRENARQGIIRADAVTVYNSGSSEPLAAVQEWLDELKKYPERINEAHIIIGSFHPNELNKDKRAHIELGHFAGNELARRLEVEGVFFINATHTDSKSGHVHNHTVIPNFLPGSDKTPRNARNFYAVKKVNDEIMRELGLSVIEPQNERHKITPEHRKDLLAGKTIDGSGKSIFELDDDTWKGAITSRIDAVFSSDEVIQAANVEDGLSAAQDIAPAYNLSIQVKENAKDDDKHGITFALVDDDGEVIRRHRKGKREGGSRVKTSKPGSYFGDVYRLAALQEHIQNLQTQWQAEQVLAALLNGPTEEEEEEQQYERIEQVTVGETDQAGVGLTDPEAVGTGEKPDAGDQETAIAGDESATAVGRYCVVSDVASSIRHDSREPSAAARQLVIDRDTEQQRQQQTTEQRRRHAVRQQRQHQQRRQAVKQNDDWEFC
ncbi:hypothetical protein FRC0182_00630 [Corynebacterium diphtheriae]|nr:hypothetical protein FRC0182_00630 [Corynebacterium diphtheriae]